MSIFPTLQNELRSKKSIYGDRRLGLSPKQRRIINLYPLAQMYLPKRLPLN
jgi:hypothetical protein